MRNPEATGICSFVYTVHIHVASGKASRMFLKNAFAYTGVPRSRMFRENTR